MAADEYATRQRAEKRLRERDCVEKFQKHDSMKYDGLSLEELAAGVGWALTKNIQDKWHNAHEAYTRDSRAQQSGVSG